MKETGAFNSNKAPTNDQSLARILLQTKQVVACDCIISQFRLPWITLRSISRRNDEVFS